MFIVDVYAPTHGVLTVGGIVSFFLGALMLFNRAEPRFRLSLRYIIPATLVTAVFFIFVVGAGLRAQFLPVRAGSGNDAWARRCPRWRAMTRAAAGCSSKANTGMRSAKRRSKQDQPVEIVGIQGLTLKVKPKNTITAMNIMNELIARLLT